MPSLARDYMSPVVETHPDVMLAEAIQKMLQAHSRVLVVTELLSDTIEGLLTATDILREMSRGEQRLLQVNVARLMTPRQRLVALAEDSLMLDAVEQMSRNNLHAIVVLNALRPVGVIHQVDVLRWWQETFAGANST